MAATLDKINSTIRLDKKGYRVERTAIVTGVTGNADTRLFNAINDAGLPNLGDAHPQISSITLRNISATPIDGDTYRVTLSYYDEPGTDSTQATADLRFSTSIAGDETNHDINGNRLHFFTNVSVLGGTVLSSGIFTAEVQRPRINLSFEYTATTYPYSDIKKYLGKVNSAPWNGYPAKTMLCTISADQDGENFRVRYSFSHNEDTWRFYAAVKGTNLNLPATAHPTKPDNSVDLFAAAKYFDVYESVDFNGLSFDLGLEYAEISGTVTEYPRTTEADIQAGGETLIITLYGGETWVTAGTTFDAQRQNIIDGLVSNKSEAAGWDASTATILPVTAVVRTSSTVVTITFVLDAGYAITETENITVTIPASALTNSATALETITPKFPIAGT